MKAQENPADPVNPVRDFLRALREGWAVDSASGRHVYQSKVDFGTGKTYLLRAIVSDQTDPAVVVTVYRTSKVDKYWRP